MRASSARTLRDRRAVVMAPIEPDTPQKSARTCVLPDSRELRIPWPPHQQPDRPSPQDIDRQTEISIGPPTHEAARSVGVVFARHEAAAAAHPPPSDETAGGFSVSRQETNFPPARVKIAEPVRAISPLHGEATEEMDSPFAMRDPTHGVPGRSPVASAEPAALPIAASALSDRASPTGGATLEPPAAQVVAAILERCGAPNQAQSGEPFRVSPAEDITHATQPLRIIRLQLSPETLGTVDIQLTMERDALRVHLEAASASTAVSLERDRAALVEQLTASGRFLADVHVGQSLPRAPNDAAHTPGTLDNSPSNASAGGSGPSAHGGRDARASHSAPLLNASEAKNPDRRSPVAPNPWAVGARRSAYSDVRVLRMV